MKVMAGRFGAYVTDGTTNATLPKDADPASLTDEEAAALIDARVAKGPAKGKKKAVVEEDDEDDTPAPKAKKKSKAIDWDNFDES